MSGRKLLAVVVSAAVLIAVIAGFLATGSPDEARKRRIDERRIEHLQAIETSIENYYDTYDTLPVSLAEMKTRASLSIELQDPSTGVPYEYRATGPREYELCAHYDGASSDESPSPYSRSWAHPAGKHCHHFTVRQRR